MEALEAMAVAWRTSDGTTIDADGNVSGSGALAESLRVTVEGIEAGRSLMVPLWPMPGGGAPVKLGDIPTMDALVRSLARTKSVTVVEAPAFEYPDDPRGEFEEPEPGVIN